MSILTISTSIALGSLIISTISLYFARKSWFESNRPIIVVRVESLTGGNVQTNLNLIVENCGNRPAKNVSLKASQSELQRLLISGEADALRQSIQRCFSAAATIPVLPNGQSVSNSFGSIGGPSPTWTADSWLNIIVTYQSLEGTHYKANVPVRVSDTAAFAWGFWRVSGTLD